MTQIASKGRRYALTESERTTLTSALHCAACTYSESADRFVKLAADIDASEMTRAGARQLAAQFNRQESAALQLAYELEQADSIMINAC